MAFTVNTSILKTSTGILKILEIILVLICLMLARFGHDSRGVPFGWQDNDFLGKGTVVGYAIIVPAVLITYLIGSNLSILELFINLVGGILFIAVGAVTIQFYNNTRSKDSTGMALGVLAIITGIVFLIDFIFAIKNTRFTFVQTRTVV
eukprot:TRINITY_DN41042_c0_g1_i1.p1 TRINITY_DN41042_c0_g1~~TRINITY_DN41042_c0_g1_i1.p1  ORF type:complete len:158 (-),score=33.62 TRINITY_DN41042_c0_g1_i1:175-621(-)